MLKFCFSVITFSLVDRFTSYSHTMLLWLIPLHQYATLWPLNDLDIEAFFTYKDLAMYFFNMSNFERQSTKRLNQTPSRLKSLRTETYFGPDMYILNKNKNWSFQLVPRVFGLVRLALFLGEKSKNLALMQDPHFPLV